MPSLEMLIDNLPSRLGDKWPKSTSAHRPFLGNLTPDNRVSGLPRFDHTFRAENLVPKKGLGCRTECFQSLTVVLQPSHSCSIISVWNLCKPFWGSAI